MTFAVFDFAAIAKLTKAFAEEPPQNEIKPQPEKPAYSYSSGDLSDQPDYGMYAGFGECSITFTIPALLPAKGRSPRELGHCFAKLLGKL